MKRYPILHPFLFGVNFVLTSLVTNISQAPLGQAIRPLLIVLLGVSALLFMLRLVVKDWDRAGFVATLCLLLALYFGHLYGLVVGLTIGGYAFERRLIFFAALCLMLGLLGSGRAWRRLEHRKKEITNLLNIISIVIIVVPIVGVAQFWVQNSGKARAFRAQQATELSIQLTAESRPDIYYIILDGYARADVLQAIYQFDNAEFIEFLTARGFYVAEKSQSNYMHTFLSLGASLNLEYLNDLVAPLAGSADRTPLTELVKHSQVRALLEDVGYQTVAFSSGFLGTEMQDAAVYLSRQDSTVNEFEWLLLSTSAAQIAVELLDLDTPIQAYEAHHKRVLYTFDQLAQVPHMSGPKFVFAHIVAPHPPFVFDRDGQLTQPDRPYFMGDADGYRGSTEEYIRQYADELAFVNGLIEQTVAAILANSSQPPIIILQADHGAGAFLAWSSVGDSCLWERFSILNAYHLPQGGADYLYDTITPVNSFRVVFDAYFGTHLGLVEDKAYFSTWDQPYDLTDISDKSQIPCPLP